MPANPLIFKDAEKARDALLVSQKKEIAALYQQWADEIGERANSYAHKSTASSVVSERQMRELQKMMEETSKQVSNEVYNGITRNLHMVADSVVQCNNEWLASLGFNPGTVDAVFNYVPDDIVRNIVSGQIYDSGWSLSSRIWSDNEDTMKQAYQIVAGGVAQNKPMYEIAKDLEKYVSPSAAKPWNLRAPDGKKIYPKDVDYNAQRLGRTLVQHGYQQSFVATTQKNPFITDYIWIANGSRVCEICSNRNGRHYPKDDLPLDHPNGMCTMVPDIVEDLTGQLADWFNSPDGTNEEIDQFASNFGYVSVLKNEARGITDEQMKAVKEYTSGSYNGINSYLRRGQAIDRQTMDNLVDNIDGYIDNAGYIPDDVKVLYRGTRLDEFGIDYKPTEANLRSIKRELMDNGGIIQNPGYLSTSRENLDMYNNGVKMLIEPIGNVKGADVSSLSNVVFEKEVLLPRNTELVVTDVSWDKKTKQIVIKAQYRG